MQIVSAPLKLSMAGIRLTGYMIENNIRVAQAFGQAAIQANPFMSHAPIASALKASRPVAKARRAAPAKAKTAQVAKPIQAAKKPTIIKKAVAANTVAKPRVKPVGKAPVKVVAKTSAETIATKPAKSPVQKTTAAAEAVAPAKAPVKKAKPTPKAIVAAKTKSAKPVVSTPPTKADAKPKRQPSAPPAMPQKRKAPGATPVK